MSNFTNKYDPSKYISEQADNLFDKNCSLHIILKDKNSGATTFIWKKLAKECVEKGNKFMYIRNTLLDAQSFNVNQYNENWEMGRGRDKNIYIVSKDSKNRAIKQQIGYYEGFSTVMHTQSQGIENCKLVIWDEFIDIDESRKNSFDRKVFEKLIMLISNTQRQNKNDFQMYIFGNRFSPNNDLLLQMGLKVSEKIIDYYQQDIIINKKQKIGEFIVLPPPKTPEAISKMKDGLLANQLAKLKPSTDIFYNKGGWGEKLTLKVISWNHLIFARKDIILSIELLDGAFTEPVTFIVFKVYEHKKWTDKDCEYIYYVKEIELGDEIYYDKKPLALTLGVWSENNIHLDDGSVLDVVEFLFTCKKTGKLYYDKKSTKDYISTQIRAWCNELNY